MLSDKLKYGGHRWGRGWRPWGYTAGYWTQPNLTYLNYPAVTSTIIAKPSTPQPARNNNNSQMLMIALVVLLAAAVVLLRK